MEGKGGVISIAGSKCGVEARCPGLCRWKEGEVPGQCGERERRSVGVEVRLPVVTSHQDRNTRPFRSPANSICSNQPVCSTPGTFNHLFEPSSIYGTCRRRRNEKDYALVCTRQKEISANSSHNSDMRKSRYTRDANHIRSNLCDYVLGINRFLSNKTPHNHDL